MNDGDKLDFSIALGDLQMKCQGELSKEKLRAYWQDLQGFSLEQVKDACKRLGTEPGRIFFPSVGEFMAVLQGSAKANANEAWADVLATIGMGGHHAGNPPKFEDQRIARALSVIGGYKQVCLTPYDEQQWLQKRFIEAYETADGSIARSEIKQIGRDEAKSLLRKLNIPALTSGDPDDEDSE